MKTVKIVQIAAELRLNKQLALGGGEAGVYNRRALRAGIELGRLGPADEDGRPTLTEVGQPIPTMLKTKNGSLKLDADYDYLTFLRARRGVMENTYDAELFEGDFTDLCEAVKGQEITFVLTTPGTFERAPKELQREREARIEEIAERYGHEVGFRFAGADLPDDQINVSDATEGLRMEDGDLFFVGSRRLEGGSETRQAVLRVAAEAILEEYSVDRLVTPHAVGLSLTMAEVAVEQGIPVVLVNMSEPSRWAPYNQERSKALQESPLVTVLGEEKYEKGRIPTVVRKLGNLARAAGVETVVVDDPAGSEARQLRGARNFWDAVAALLGANGESIEQSTSTETVVVETASWDALAEGAPATEEAPAAAPFETTGTEGNLDNLLPF